MKRILIFVLLSSTLSFAMDRIQVRADGAATDATTETIEGDARLSVPREFSNFLNKYTEIPHEVVSETEPTLSKSAFVLALAGNKALCRGPVEEQAYGTTEAILYKFDPEKGFWKCRSDKQLRLLRHLRGPVNVQVNGAAFNDVDTKLVIGYDDNCARIWDIEQGVVLLTLSGHSAPVYGVVFSREGDTVATTSCDHTAKIWDSRTGGCLHTLSGHGQEVFNVEFRSDGKKLITGSSDGTIRVWDVKTGSGLLVIPQLKHWNFRCTFNEQGNKIVASRPEAPKTTIHWDYQCLESFLRTMTREQVLLLLKLWGIALIKSPSQQGSITVKVDFTDAQDEEEVYNQLPKFLTTLFDPYVIRKKSWWW